MRKLSFVIPCYNSEKTIEGVIKEIIETTQSIEWDYEIILINDCSKDKTWDTIKSLCKDNKKIKGITFSKNFGQPSAIMAGLKRISGKYVVCLDDDGQAPVDELPKLVNKIEEGYDVVFSKYPEVKQSFFRNFTSKINAIMARIMTEKPKGISTASFFIMRKYVAENIVLYESPYPYLSGLIFRITHNAANVSVSHRERKVGQSGYTFKKLLKLWINGFTSFSILPLRVAIVFGFVFAVVGILLAIFVVIRKIMIPEIQMGYTSLMAMNSFLGGVILFCIGGVGEYIGRSYMCINKTPQYIIKETSDMEEDSEE